MNPTMISALADALRAMDADALEASKRRRSVTLFASYEGETGETVHMKPRRFAAVDAAEKAAEQLRANGCLCTVSA